MNYEVMNDDKKSKINRLRQKFGMESDWYDLYPFRTNEQGINIIDSKSLLRLGVNDSFYSVHYTRANILFDFKTVYGYPNLKQTGYGIDLAISDWTNYSEGEEFQYNQAMRLEEIKVKFPKQKHEKLLTLYLDSKVSDLEHVGELQYILNEIYDEEPEGEFRGFKCLSPKNVSKILSSDYESRFSKIGDRINMEIIGNEWIFESRELLDQLVISMLIYCARQRQYGWSLVAHEILFVLLQEDIKRITLEYFQYVKRIKVMREEREEVLTTAQQFVSRVILDDVSLPRRFRFVPDNNQSLRHFLVGTGHMSQGGWIPKLQQYFAEEILPHYVQDSQNRFDPEWREEEDLILSHIGDEKLSRDFNRDMVLSQIRAEIAKWPEREREIFLMKYDEDLTLDKIGGHFSIKKSYVSKILKRKELELRQRVAIN